MWKVGIGKGKGGANETNMVCFRAGGLHTRHDFAINSEIQVTNVGRYNVCGLGTGGHFHYMKKVKKNWLNNNNLISYMSVNMVWCG